jgi:hypothetical protein
MVKPQMFGRAGLPLLRKRVLLTAKNQRRAWQPSPWLGVTLDG